MLSFPSGVKLHESLLYDQLTYMSRPFRWYTSLLGANIKFPNGTINWWLYQEIVSGLSIYIVKRMQTAETFHISSNVYPCETEKFLTKFIMLIHIKI